MQPLTIGKLAKAAGIGVETVRFYEREGLIQKPSQRLRRGYRQYDATIVDRLAFIRRAKDLGFSLKEIRELLNLRATSKSKCASVRAKAFTKISEVEKKISDLTAIRAALERLAMTCNAEPHSADCPILDALSQTEGT